MKLYITTFVLLLVLVTSVAQRSSNSKTNQMFSLITQIDTIGQHLIHKGNLVNVYVEKAIFHSPDNKNFLLKFTVKNISTKPIGVDISNYWKVFYPNQWGFYKNAERDVINEIRLATDKTLDTSKILKKFKDNSLTIINPNERLEYYRDWNGSGKKVEFKNKNEYLIISMDGQLLVTDGMHLENVTLADEAKRDMVLSHPIGHKIIPGKSLIIKQQGFFLLQKP